MSTETMVTQPAQIAVLMTCHNRCETTLACLHILHQQDADFEVYLVDDGSRDGTAHAVQANYPAVNILQGHGSLFWVGGMRMAFQEALQSDHSYYLWLNDDTLLEPGALKNLLETHQFLMSEGQSDSIIVGSIKDPITGKQTYGGRSRPKRWYSFKFEAVEPAQVPKACDTMQGNVVLIPHSVAEKVGNIDTAFIHTLGDLDYGLRARKLGCSIWVAPGFVASCPQNSVQGSWADLQLPVHQRLQKVFQIKGFPLKAWTIYLQRHSGPLWLIYWLLPYLRAVIGYKNLDESPSFCEVPEQSS
ncbi:MAG: glycosyltransferase family 2 protein [Thermosynechococcaceae cyanobacterium]